MDDSDTWVRLLLIWAAAVLVITYGLGGLVTRVAGFWHDGKRRVVLHQIGPLVWGEALWPEGRQNYRGRVSWGRLKLTRFDFGAQHLRSLGFNDEQVPVLEGQVTGHLQFRVRDGKLMGRFFGRKFSFEKNKIRSVSVVAPVQRQWQPYTGADNED